MAGAKSYLALILSGTVLAAFSLTTLILYTDPYKAGAFTHLLFYVSVFLVVTGAVTMLELAFRKRFSQAIYLINLGNSFRQALLIAVLITASLLLQAQGLLYWWVEAGLILFLAFLELFLSL